jgi:hypothetical protein
MQVKPSQAHGSGGIGPQRGPGGQVSSRTSGASIRAWMGVASSIAAATLLFWCFDALPFQDLPAHAGLIALRHRFAHSPFEQRFFVLAPHFGPYSLFRFLGDLLVVPLGPVRAVRALATIPVVATPLALAWARRRLHRDASPAAAYYGVALGFGFMTLLGFASYLLGIAALIVGLTMWLELLETTDPRVALRREAVVSCVALLIFVAHGDAFVLFLGLAAAASVATGNRWRRLTRLRALAPSFAIAAWAAWSSRVAVVPAGSVAMPRAAMNIHFQGLADKLSLLVTPTLMTRSGVDVLVGLFVWGVVGAAVAATARSVAFARATEWDSATTGSPGRTRCTDASNAPSNALSNAHSRTLLVLLATLASAFAILPHSIGWFGFVDGRLVPLLLILGVMAVQRPALGRTLGRIFDRGAPLAASSMTVVALVASYLFQREAAGWREVLAAVPADARLLNLPLDPNSDVFTAHPFVHYDKLVLAERPTIVSDLWFHQGTAVYPTAGNPALRLPAAYIESDLHGIDWPAYRLADWDYVLIRTRPAATRPDVPNALTLSCHRGGWWLFRTVPVSPLIAKRDRVL